ncbi:acetylglutamate kinase [Siphonobacter sp. BAB-5385]|uniref:acetylglutamate kinase n=1 Tax=unclassified Siphonobacter TaxID=2635712 RepID=UPI000B9E9AEB|nr:MULTISPECIES: acetylglutamate kinase [unclassified Siphonobacter]OZI09892.1 acetylglutamate kinase [Siphonobacter sp. BAB-5385]PMD97730.1 acetylglutamate kinase [Siphonobacter sp. BAB-5405]
MLTVIKIGGNVVDNPTLRQQFLADFAALPLPKILVHGGGKIATQVAVKLDVETVMVEGRRVTDAAMLDVVTMVYGGLVNKQLVAQLQALDCNALGLTGADGGIIRSKKRTGWNVDYGFVGDIESVNEEQIKRFLEVGLVPVFAPLTFDPALASMLNTNADTQAQAVAVALAKHFEVNLVYCFEKKGVLTNPEDDTTVISELYPGTYTEHKASGAIYAGMIPKLDNAFKALHDGVKQVTICHATDLRQAVSEGTTGTRIRLTE